jgi:hypothetical protein
MKSFVDKAVLPFLEQLVAFVGQSIFFEATRPCFGRFGSPFVAEGPSLEFGQASSHFEE